MSFGKGDAVDVWRSDALEALWSVAAVFYNENSP